jgi:hypothetical protein
MRAMRNLLAALVLVGGLTMGGAVLADEVKVPQTVEDHMALVKKYEESAASYRKEAEEHRAMAAAYKKNYPKDKTGRPNPWAVKMEKHCMVIAKDADKLAAEATKAAEFHKLRAGELQGK